MSWFKNVVTKEDFDNLFNIVKIQNTEINKLGGKVQYLDTELSLLRIRVTELENSNKPLASQPIKRQEDRTPQHYSGHSNATQMCHIDSSPDLSTVMLVSALVSDSGSSRSCDSSSSSSCDSSSSCGGE